MGHGICRSGLELATVRSVELFRRSEGIPRERCRERFGCEYVEASSDKEKKFSPSATVDHVTSLTTFLGVSSLHFSRSYQWTLSFPPRKLITPSRVLFKRF